MRTNEDIENYLIKRELPYDELAEGFWVIHDEYDDIEDIVIVHTPPVITFQVKLMRVPNERQSELYETLLRLNASEMVQGAYAIDDDDHVVCVDSLQSENLDYNEFVASVESLQLAISTHYQILKEFHVLTRKARAQEAAAAEAPADGE